MKTVHLNPIEFGKTPLEEFEGMTLINLLEQKFQDKKFVLLTFWDETTGEFKKLQIWNDGELQTTEVYDLSSPE